MPSPLLLLFLLLPFTSAASLRLPLLRRPLHTNHFGHLANTDRLRNLHQNSTLSNNKCRALNASFAMPINSAAYTGTGQYFVLLRVGTPAQKFLLVADTGSDLTWMNCRYKPECRRCNKNVRTRRVFQAAESRTFKPINCSSEMCRTVLPFSLTTCPTPDTPCAYDYGYSDGSTAQGFYAHEWATVTHPGNLKTKLKKLVIGCTSAFSGTSFRTSDGVLGLGYSSISFANHAIKSYGGRFSYCLVDHLSPRNATSYLTFGTNPAFLSAKHTPLLIEPRLEPFYAVGVEGISVGGEVLRIPMSVWNVSRGGGAIIDSGTSLTVLTEPAYKAVVAAISRHLTAVPRVTVDPFEYCYNWTFGHNATLPEVPQLVVHFNGTARLEPPAKSYLIDVGPGVKCIGLTSTTWPGVSTIGNILQQEHLWEFDIRNRQLRFERSSCGGKI